MTIETNVNKAPKDFGNQLFPFALGCILSLLTGQGIPRFRAYTFLGGLKGHLPKEIANNPLTKFEKTITITNDNAEKIFKNIEDYKETNIIIRNEGIQNAKFFKDHVDFLKSCLNLKMPTKQNTKDIVIHLRLDDFNHSGYDSEIIDIGWYDEILKKEKYDNLYIVYDINPHLRGGRKEGWRRLNPGIRSAEEKYLKLFNKYNPIIRNNSLMDDIYFISSFDRIICSASTFCWWAALFSNASKVYYPKANGLAYFNDNNIVTKSYKRCNILTL